MNSKTIKVKAIRKPNNEINVIVYVDDKIFPFIFDSRDVNTGEEVILTTNLNE